ncbi:hypothetical protein PIB30_074252 [Stylosanthes scabra]|uniref:Retrotransposon gag domain-containing protein n=1 Tax=Stylosanthes scabra TaxID=79078 RepID=A0ABU6QQS2_9FABA|nr:hypothetical protein [Stylosanthes scabra]
MDEEIPLNNEGAADSNNPQSTPEKEVDHKNQTIQQLEAALRELLERQTREATIASEVVKRAEELVKKQQAILDEAERREKDILEKLSNKTQTMIDQSSKTAESKDHTWRPSTVVTKASGREKSKHPFSSHILAKELPKKFRMLLVNASDNIQCKAFTITLKKDALIWFNSLPPGSIECFSDLADSFIKNFTTRRRLPKTCLNLYLIVQKPEETLRSYLDRFNTECTRGYSPKRL